MAITPIDENAAALVKQGGVTETARDPNMQVASASGILKTILQTSKQFKQTTGSAAGQTTDSALPKITKEDKEVGVVPQSVRVPTPFEERLAPEPYSFTQERLAPEVLSKEGLIRFKDAGYSAKTAIEPPPVEEGLLQEALAEVRQEASEIDIPEVLRESVMTTDDEAIAFLPAVEKAQKVLKETDDVSKAGIDFNFKYLTQPEDILAVVNATSEQIKDSQDILKRGIRTWEDTGESASAMLANNLGITEQLLKRKVGETWNADQFAAARYLHEKSMQKLSKITAEILEKKRNNQSIDSTLLLSFKRQQAVQYAIQAQYVGARTETARAMNAFKMPTSDIDPALYAKTVIDNTGGEADVLASVQGLADSLEKNGIAGGSRFVSEAGKTLNRMWQSGYLNGLLSNPRTQAKNFFGTGLFMGYQTGEDFLAGIYGEAIRGTRSALGLKSTDPGVSVIDPILRWWGYRQAFDDAIKVGYDAFRTSIGTDVISRSEISSVSNIDSVKLFSNDIWKAAYRETGRALNVPSRLLLGVDEFWKTLAMRGELYVESAYAARRAIANGKSTEEAVDDGLMVMLDPRSVRDELDTQARYNTLTTDLGDVQKIAGRIQQNPFGRLVLAFFTAPTNGILRFFERTPLAAVFYPRVTRDLLGKNGARAQQKTLARLSVGALVTGKVIEMATSGQITGGYPREAKERRKLPPNWQPYSFVFRGENWSRDKDGDLLPLLNPKTGLYNGEVFYLSFGGLEPVGALFGVVSQGVESIRRTSDVTKQDEIFTGLVLSQFNYMLEQPMMQGLSNVYTAFDREDASHLIDSPMGNMIPYTGIIPNPRSSLFRGLNKLYHTDIKRSVKKFDLYTLEDIKNMDPNEDGTLRYELIGTKKGAESGYVNFVGEQISNWLQLQKDANLFFTKDNMAPVYDVMGEQKSIETSFQENPIIAMYNFFLPFKYVKGRAPTLVEKELVRIGMPLRENKKLRVGSQVIPLNEKQSSDWTNYAKNEVALQGKNIGIAGNQMYKFRPAIAAAMQTTEYSKLTVDDRYNFIQQIENEFYEAALAKLLFDEDNANLLQAVVERKNLEASGVYEVMR